MCNRYYLPVTVPVFTMLLAASVATAARLAGIDMEARGGADIIRSVKYSDVTTLNGIRSVPNQFSVKKTEPLSNGLIDVVHEQRVRFAAAHGVADPAALVAAVRHSPMANLLISVAIEESRGDPVAVGSAGEKGAWQVKPASWGLVPQDIHGQASQAERIIRDLLIYTKGNKIKALAHYNGGSSPPGKSYRYAKRILKRAGHLHVAVNFLLPDYTKSVKFSNDPPGYSRML